VTAGGEKLALEPSLFALYWMLAERCRQGRVGVLRKERKDIGKELLDYYGRLVNPNSGAFDRSSQAFSRNFKKSSRGFDATHFDPKKRHINDQLTRAIGDRAAAPYLIVVLDRDPVSKLNRYGLKLPPEVISVDSASLRWAALDWNGKVTEDHSRGVRP
jgi:hypothetical protein